MAEGGTHGDKMLMGRMVAGVELLGRTGAKEVEIAYDDDGPVRWWCGALWQGTKLHSEFFPYPAQAVEDLLSRVVNGGGCARCGRTTVVGVLLDGDFCCFTLTAKDVDDDQSYKWVRTCEVEAA